MDTRKDRKNCGCSENHSGRNEPQRGAGGKGHGEKSLGHLSISRDTRESRESRDHRSSSSNCSGGCSISCCQVDGCIKKYPCIAGCPDREKSKVYLKVSGDKILFFPSY